jgi:hypothetical protein
VISGTCSSFASCETQSRPEGGKSSASTGRNAQVLLAWIARLGETSAVTRSFGALVRSLLGVWIDLVDQLWTSSPPSKASIGAVSASSF